MRLDHVSRADSSQLLGPSSALSTDGADVQAAVLSGAAFYTRTSLGAPCRTSRAGEVDRGRLPACVLCPAFCDGLDRGNLGRGRRSPAPQDLASAAAGRDSFRDLAGE